MSWTPFDRRSEDIKQLVVEISSLSGQIGPEQFYNQNECGLLNDDELSKYLLRSHESILEVNSHHNVLPEEAPEEDQAADIVSLKYLKERANSYSDRQWAEMLYEELLVKLWVQRVELTGETYYPRLADHLFESYELSKDEYHE